MKKPRSPAPETIPCLLCGYDLTGLTEGAPCPECNSPAGPSIRRNLFELIGAPNGKWIVRGLRLARDAALAGLIAAALVHTAAWTGLSVLAIPGSIGILISAPVFAVGWWLATRLPRSPGPVAGAGTVRTWTRLSVLSVPLLWLIIMAATVGLFGPRSGLLSIIVPLSGALLAVAFIARFICTCAWTGRLCLLLGDDRTFRRARWRIRATPLFFVGVIAVLVAPALGRDLFATVSLSFYFALATAIALVASAFGAYAWLYIGLIHYGLTTTRRALAEAAARREHPGQEAA